jgi:hypothetical protein
MNSSKRALLLVGSPRGARSNSESLGAYLLEQFRERGLETEKLRIYALLKSDESWGKLLGAVDRAGIIALAAPLYADSAPSGVIRAMELILEARRGQEGPKKPWFVAIVNCGFPEARQSETALRIYRRFAAEAGLQWAGGLALGGGEAIGRRPLDKTGRMLRHVRRSLDLTADALAEGRSVPDEAVAFMAKPVIPKWLYLLVGGISWRVQAKRQGAAGTLHDRPYAG